MNNKKTRAFAMALAVFLAAVLLFGLIYSAVAPQAGAVSALDKLRNNAKALEGEKEKIQAELAQIKSEKASVVKQKTVLDRQIEITEQEIQNTTTLIQELSAEIARKQEELDEALRSEAEEYEAFRTRIRVMEEAGDTQYLGILLASDSFSDMLERMSIIQEIMDYDLKLMDDLKESRERIEETKKSLEADKDEQAAVKEELAKRQAELVTQRGEQVQLIKDLEKEENEYRKAYEEAEEAERDLKKQIDDLMKELARKKSVYVGGTYTWPLPGYSIGAGEGSKFGTRVHPILNVEKFHSGVDIPAPTGTKILAANSGEVIKATYNGGYGNCVVIDHGGGKATLYGHMSRFAVSAGQQVKKGDVIGYVGSTGLSTGPHLHFEIIENGSPVNPMNHFSKVSG